MGVVPDAQRAGPITNESGASSPTAMHNCCRVHRELNRTRDSRRRTIRTRALSSEGHSRSRPRWVLRPSSSRLKKSLRAFAVVGVGVQPPGQRCRRCGGDGSRWPEAASLHVSRPTRLKTSEPVRCGSPTLGRFDSGAAPLSRNTLGSQELLPGEGEVTEESTRAFLTNYMEEFRTYIERVLTVIPRPEGSPG